MKGRFHEVMRDARIARGLTCIQLAAEAGINVRVVRAIEDGERGGTWTSVHALALALRMSFHPDDGWSFDETEAAAELLVPGVTPEMAVWP
jgi:hypothetical protein